MKISWKWLQEWADLEGLSVDDVTHRLTMAGLEVDGVERLGEGSDDIVVARIDSITQHPDADKLVLCELTLGGGQTSRVVCGAKNMVEGDFVALAQPGSHPPGVDFDIVARKVRGEMSHGMLCSGSELGLEDDTDGILILSRSAELGTPAFEAMGLKDTIIEIDLTPNRPDCLGHLGVARELSALYGRALKAPAGWASAPLWQGAEATQKVDQAATLIVEDSDGCPRYLFAVIEDVKVAPSPAWLSARLTAVGLRSVNNIVDITNYILMELNQPLHVFDLDKLEGPEIRVRRAAAGETLVGIDHNEYKLDAGDLIIADAARPVAIAGVMGGAESEVDETTTRVLIECAYFEPTTVRRSARRHNLHTDSSHRFERGIDPGGLPAALARAISLMLRTQESLDSAPTVRQGIVEHCVDTVTQNTQITLPKSMPARILGIDPSEDIIAEYLGALGIKLESQQDAWQCTIPTYRPDLQRPIDLVEEVARLYGYDAIPATLPRSSMGYTHRVRPEETRHPETIVSRDFRRIMSTIRTQLLAFGLYEVVNYGFMSAQELDLLRIAPGDRRRETARLANPLVADDAFMQTTMLPGLLKNLTLNRARRRKNIAIFETGRRYFKDAERPTLGILLSGQKEHHWSGNKSWDFYDLKGLVEALCRPFATADLQWRVPAAAEPYLHPGVQAEWVLGERAIASLGRLHPEVAAELDVDSEVFVAELYLDEVFALDPLKRRFSPPPRFPAVTRDFALTYGLKTPYSALERAIWRLADEDPEFGALFESFELFDVYAGEQVAEGMRSLALSVVYRAADKTLTDKLVERADQRLIDWLQTQVQASLRG